MASSRPYYEFREIAKGLTYFNEAGQRTLEAAASMDGKTADELFRLHHLALQLEEAIGSLDGGIPADAEAVWGLLPDIERELCRWTYESPLQIAWPAESDAERGLPTEPTLSEPYHPRWLLDRLNAARVELAALEPQSLVIDSAAVGTPSLSSLDAPGV